MIRPAATGHNTAPSELFKQPAGLAQPGPTNSKIPTYAELKRLDSASQDTINQLNSQLSARRTELSGQHDIAGIKFAKTPGGHTSIHVTNMDGETDVHSINQDTASAGGVIALVVVSALIGVAIPLIVGNDLDRPSNSSSPSNESPLLDAAAFVLGVDTSRSNNNTGYPYTVEDSLADWRTNTAPKYTAQELGIEQRTFNVIPPSIRNKLSPFGGDDDRNARNTAVFKHYSTGH